MTEEEIRSQLDKTYWAGFNKGATDMLKRVHREENKFYWFGAAVGFSAGAAFVSMSKFVSWWVFK